MFNSYVSLPEGIWAPIPENRLLCVCVCVCVQIDIEDTLVIYYFYSQKKGDIDV